MTDTQALSAALLDVIAEEDPLAEAIAGYPHFADRLADLDPAAQRALRDRAADIADRAAGLDADPVDRAVVVQQAGAVVTRLDARLVEHTMSGYDHSALGRILGALSQARPATPEEEAAFFDRLAAVPEFLAGAADRHRLGAASGRIPVASRLDHARARVDAYLAGADPFADIPVSAPDVLDKLRSDVVRPAFVAYREVLDRLSGRDDDRPGLCWLPDGGATYEALAATHTTTAHTPEQLHAIGVDLIAGLDAEYAAIGAEVFGPCGAAEVRARLRADPALRWADAAGMLAAARAAVDRAGVAARPHFGLFPAADCAVEPSPDADGPVGYYLAAVGSRPGTYYVNVGSPAERGRYTAEATAFHEAVPGHHVQLTLAAGLPLPELRRRAWINAYIEGWGLYAERLADEIGLYSTPLDRLGMLAMDSLRAARLVVDTGIHALGWSRPRVVDYLSANTLLSPVEAAIEADRYIEFPGQALSYMVGRLEIQRLRARCEAAMGARFDLRAFHDVALGGGPLPLTVLGDVLARWASA